MEVPKTKKNTQKKGVGGPRGQRSVVTSIVEARSRRVTFPQSTDSSGCVSHLLGATLARVGPSDGPQQRRGRNLTVVGPPPTGAFNLVGVLSLVCLEARGWDSSTPGPTMTGDTGAGGLLQPGWDLGRYKASSVLTPQHNKPPKKTPNRSQKNKKQQAVQVQAWISVVGH